MTNSSNIDSDHCCMTNSYNIDNDQVNIYVIKAIQRALYLGRFNVNTKAI